MTVGARSVQLTSRERLLLAIEHEAVDRVPISCRMFGQMVALERRFGWRSPFERAVGLAELGVDDVLWVHPPWPYHPDVVVRQWWEKRPDERYGRMFKVFETPKGDLRLVVRASADYMRPDLPLITDYNWTRASEFLIRGPEDLDKLAYVLHDPGQTDLSGYFRRMEYVMSFARAHHVLVQGNIESISDAALAFLGPTAFCYLAMDDRDFLKALLRMFQDWTTRRLEVLLDVGIDVAYSQGAYETTDLFSPQLVRELFHPFRRETVELAHQGGAKFKYFVLSGLMPFITDYKELGIDIVSGLDPLVPGASGVGLAADLAQIKATMGDTVCMWGGVEVPRVLERGTTAQVREAVRTAISICAPGGGYVLAPAGGSFETGDTATENAMAFIEAGLEFGRYPLSGV